MSARNHSTARFNLALTFCVAVSACLLLCPPGRAADDAKAGAKPDAKPDAKPKGEWKSLFDGKSLAGWKTTQFGAHGEAEVKDGNLVIPMGDPLSGVTREKDDVPHVNYEVALEAKKVEGSDFFVGLTFPVEKSFASLILGGWSGGVCGISSIDHMDASENSTTSYHTFKKDQWYKVRLRVQKDRIQAWVDDEKIVDADIDAKKLSVRVEVDPSKPFGFATYRTTSHLRNIRIRELRPEELKAAEKENEKDAGKDPAK
jgi:hypothetical protein